METEIKQDDLIITVKESGGKHQLPFTWVIRDVDKTMIRFSEDAHLTFEEAVADAKDYISKYLNH